MSQSGRPKVSLARERITRFNQDERVEKSEICGVDKG